MNNKGYTVVEMLILFVVVGVIAIFSIGKVTYSFSNKEKITLRDNAYLIIESEAKKYGEKNIKIFEKKDDYYMNVNDLVKAGYILKDNKNTILGFDDLNDKNIKISYDGKDVKAVILNKDWK